MSTDALRRGQYGSVTPLATRLPRGAADPDAPEAGSRSEFDRLYEEHFDFVWRAARRLGVPEAAADDVVQDVFLVLHRRLDEYDRATPLRRWLFGIIVRVVSDHRRRFKRKEAPCVPHAADSDGNVLIASPLPPPSVEAEQAESVRLLDEILSTLDEPKRELLVLAQLEEMTVPEIAEQLGENVNTIYARLRVARREFEAAYARHRARNARKGP